jgi:YVTN family beta-propeller protein
MCGRQIELCFHKSFSEDYNNREITMKCLFTITFILLIIPSLPAQQVINNILLPDSMGGMPEGAYCCVYNETNNCVYAGGLDLVIVIDGTTNQKIARIPVTGYITAMLWVPGENKIFCICYDKAKVTIIDGANNSVITTVPVGVYPICLEYNSTDNLVYCANLHSRDITLIDAANNSPITTWLFWDEPADMAWNGIENELWCVGKTAWANYPGFFHTSSDANFRAIIWNATDNKMYFSDLRNDYLYIHYPDSSTGRSVGISPTALCWNATSNKVYCANRNNVSVIDGITDNVIDTITTGNKPVRLFWNSADNKVYCFNNWSDNITVIDGVTDTVITTVQIKYPYDDGDAAKPQLILNDQNDKLYFPQPECCEVRIINGGNNNIIEDVVLGIKPYALTWNETSNKLYSINWNPRYGDGSISIIDGLSMLPISTLPVGNTPIDVVWNGTNNTIYCANRDSDNLTVIDGISDLVIDTIAVGDQPEDILWNSASNKIYTANRNGNNVSIIDGTTHALLTTVPVGTYPQALTWNNANKKIYCCNSVTDNVTVIDGFSNTVISTIPVGNRPQDLLWNATSNKVYCANYGSPGKLSIIDGVMDTVITDVPVTKPIGLTWNATDNKVYCTCQSTSIHDIIIIDGESNQKTNTIHLGEGELYIQELFWNSLDNKLYCYYHESGITNHFHRLTIIDGVSDSILTTLSLGESSEAHNFEFPGCFAANLQGNRIFLAHRNMSKILAIDPTATGIISEPLAEEPESFFLQQNYPNPFNLETVISFQLSAVSPVSLKVYDIAGREVAELVKGTRTAGEHIIKWNASNQASGVYFYQLQAGSYVKAKKMILMR